jgi:hypothetical protein
MAQIPDADRERLSKLLAHFRPDGFENNESETIASMKKAAEILKKYDLDLNGYIKEEHSLSQELAQAIEYLQQQTLDLLNEREKLAQENKRLKQRFQSWSDLNKNINMYIGSAFNTFARPSARNNIFRGSIVVISAITIGCYISLQITAFIPRDKQSSKPAKVVKQTPQASLQSADNSQNDCYITIDGKKHTEYFFPNSLKDSVCYGHHILIEKGKITHFPNSVFLTGDFNISGTAKIGSTLPKLFTAKSMSLPKNIDKEFIPETYAT